MDSHKQHIGWFQALFTVLVLWGINNVLDIYSIRVLNVNAVIYACASFASCALVLIFYAGPGSLAKETIRSVDTWIFGFCVLLTYIVGLNLFSLVSATEGTLILRFSMVTAVFASWFFLSRKPSKGQLLGTFLVFISIIYICEHAPNEIKPLVYALMLLSAFLQTIRVFTAEFHRPHNKAVKESNDEKAKVRVIGFIMFAVSTIFITLAVLLAFLHDMNPNSFAIHTFPTLEDFTHPASIITGLAVGIFFIAPIRLLEFSSINKIKTENFLTIASFSFVATWAWEWALQPVTGLSIKSLSTGDIIAGFVITLGGLIIAIEKMFSKKNSEKFTHSLEYASQDLERIDDSREILANTLEHFDGDVKKSAAALNLEPIVLDAMLEDKDKVLAFKTDVLKEVSRQYRRKVALSDALTGLANRAGFMTALKGAAHEAEIYSLLYIDLDKFKPVNDTYGHDAGDYILKGVAERLNAMFPKGALSTRLGGDEFCVLLLNTSKEKALECVENIQAQLEIPFEFDGNDITIGASIGVASYPEDGTDPEALLKQADEGMFSDKKER